MTNEQTTQLAIRCAKLMLRDRAAQSAKPMTQDDYNDIAGQITLLPDFQFVSCIDIVIALQSAHAVAAA